MVQSLLKDLWGWARFLLLVPTVHLNYSPYGKQAAIVIYFVFDGWVRFSHFDLSKDPRWMFDRLKPHLGPDGNIRILGGFYITRHYEYFVRWHNRF